MSDQCRYCSIRGLSISRCEDTKEIACSIPESWYVQELKAALAEKDAMKKLREKLIAEQGAEIAKLRQDVERLQEFLNKHSHTIMMNSIAEAQRRELIIGGRNP